MTWSASTKAMLEHRAVRVMGRVYTGNKKGPSERVRLRRGWAWGVWGVPLHPPRGFRRRRMCFLLQDQVPEGSLKWYQAAENRNQTIGGFASFTVTSRHMTVTFHDQDGRPMYSSVEMPPRSKVQKPPVQGN